VTNALAIIAVGVSIGALAVSVWTGKYNKRSAVAAEDSAATAKEAGESAKAAAESAASVARVELDRDHEAYRPQLLDAHFEIVDNERTGGDNLFYVFTLTRSYRAAGDKLEGDSRSPLGLDLVLPAGKPIRVHVDGLRPVQDQSAVKSLHLRFWPPADADPVEWWTCRCGRPTESGNALHWEVQVPVETPPRHEPMVAWA
jgi:hypothetical protein